MLLEAIVVTAVDEKKCPVPFLQSTRRAAPREKVPDTYFPHDPGPLRFTGRVGEYTYQAFHGPQFSAAAGGFTLDRKSEGQDVVRLPRHADVAQEGWFSGDLMSHVAPSESLRWLSAEDLTMAAVVSRKLADQRELDFDPNPQSASGRWVHNSSYYDARPGSGLLLHHWMPPADVPAHLPSSRLIVMAKQAEASGLPVHVEIQRMWARDVPIWLASGFVDSIQVLSNHLTYDGEGGEEFEPLVDPDPGRFRGPRGPGRMVEYFYWQVLESGLRIPPTAGSGFGSTPSPLGYNRVYAYSPHTTPDAWWKAVQAGRTFVTSGPLLRTTVNGELPGNVFSAAEGQTIPIDIALTLTVADPVEYLDVIFNGQTLYQARLDEHAKQGGKIPPQAIRESGWLVVRVVTERGFTHRIASTAPYYFEIGNQPRISRSAVTFFRDWLEASATQLRSQDETTRAAAEPYLAAARLFWQQRQAEANVE
jgi:hypothetical protein